jgi:ABC-type transport system involved in cytochrome c biogenesis ATPase subunit
MRIRTVELKRFKRFHHLKIELPDGLKLVILAGPNGCGKSLLFEAFHFWHRSNSGIGFGWDLHYYPKAEDPDASNIGWSRGENWSHQISLSFYGNVPPDQPEKRRLFYIRSAYRNDPQFESGTLSKQGAALDEVRINRLIDNDIVVGRNYQRLASQTLEDLFVNEADTVTIGAFREKTIGGIRASMKRVFPDLLLNDLGNPLMAGTFRFDKGTSRHFPYMNLSGGEKAAFDLLLDLLVKRRAFDNTVYCIDEPEAHISSRLQATLLDEMVRNLPGDSQLLMATHSVGMMRRARDIEREMPGSVAFLDFSDLDFDQPQSLKPARTTRAFWERMLNVALDDLSSLVAPSRVIVCEGAPAGHPGKNTEHDATIYNLIFETEFPDAKFISAGNSTDVQADRLSLVAGIRALVSGCEVLRLIDRDDHSGQDVRNFTAQGIRVLSRRHLESYLYDDEVLTALCAKEGKPNEAANLLKERQEALHQIAQQGKPADDLKSAAGRIYVSAKRRLSLVGVGNDANAFARNVLAPLITPEMTVYKELRRAIFDL